MKELLASRRSLLVGVIHLPPLPGAPAWGGSMKAVVGSAVADARAYARGGADALVIENFGDLPFGRGTVAAETVAAMAVAGHAVKSAVKLPLGFNVLRNDPLAGLALCAACGGSFIRVNVHTGAMITDQGLIQGDAHATVRRRRELDLGSVAILADVHVKHATPLGNLAIGDAARDTHQRGRADGLIVSGIGTGHPTALEDLMAVRRACPGIPIFLGSGVTAANVGRYRAGADGFIVASSLKRGGRLDQPVDVRRVRALRRRLE